MSTNTRVTGPAGVLDRDRIALGVIDVGLLIGLVTYGFVHHGGDPLTDPFGAVESLVPFVVGWAIASVLTGLYAKRIYATPSRAARYTALCWIAAANLGLIIRSSPLFEGGAAYPFNLVMTGTGLVVFVLWRTVFAARGT